LPTLALFLLLAVACWVIVRRLRQPTARHRRPSAERRKERNERNRAIADAVDGSRKREE
jgi:hypothetical protein